MAFCEPLDDHTIVLERHTPLYLISNTRKGRGVFAGKHIPSGTIIDTCPVLVIDPKENQEHIQRTSLYHYTYNWPILDSAGNTLKTQAIVFGLGSMFNHSRRDQNVGWKRDVENDLVLYRALRDIPKGEELCISYGDHLTFEDADESDTNGVVEDGDEVLGKIQLDA